MLNDFPDHAPESRRISGMFVRIGPENQIGRDPDLPGTLPNRIGGSESEDHDACFYLRIMIHSIEFMHFPAAYRKSNLHIFFL